MPGKSQPSSSFPQPASPALPHPRPAPCGAAPVPQRLGTVAPTGHPPSQGLSRSRTAALPAAAVWQAWPVLGIFPGTSSHATSSPCQRGPPGSLALTCCPKRVLWQGWGELCWVCPGWQSPRPGAGWDSPAQSSFSPTPDGKAIQPCSPPLPFRKQLVVVQSRERFPREPYVHLGNAHLGLNRDPRKQRWPGRLGRLPRSPALPVKSSGDRGSL